MQMSIYGLALLFFSCNPSYNTNKSLIQSEKSTITERFEAPEGFETISSGKNTFAYYLQHLPLKPMDSKVKYFDGSEKMNFGVYCSVVDMEIDAQDLQQCADAVMRLRGEYLYAQKRYQDIHFNFVSDGKPRYYSDYVKGDYSYNSFRKYMRFIFSYANTASLHNELKNRPWKDMQVGDVLVQKKNPYGHAVIVINMAKDSSGNALFMLAQSYMPAQETQVLVNPDNTSLSPWYQLKDGKINTPEWDFNTSDLKHF